MRNVDVRKVAAFLNVTPCRVQQLVKEGMPRGARRQYDPIKRGEWYEKRAISATDGTYSTIREELPRYAKSAKGSFA
jgi:hypothetical protein